ncbi:GH36-type glycosyl hydrolase domain-containing protein [Uliginosibacterium sp. H1]|uniref:GH36-type glycosyl hydrolase domain-containing protein n=1 Tax=Uliginosibacterium sp. H1 TaxID=3114757 RepID=UPI002E16D45A|nr:glucoamylase family protein [Uliginosibacterium sp. H1]
MTDVVAAKRRITPAAEWLLDNFYLIEEQIRTTRRHLPRGYSRELPCLARPPGSHSPTHPRVYDIALEIVSHGDGRVDADVLHRFLSAYQGISPLTLGELWAVPIMLRLAIIENLRRVGVHIASGSVERTLAENWADKMSEAAENDPKSLILVIADMARSLPPMMSPFVAELSRRLRGRGPALALPLTWIEQRLAELDLTIEQLVQSEGQQQAANQLSISNSIGSLRVFGAIDWQDFVESMSVVEHVLHEDPDGTYGNMDFGTRDRYRHVIERVARQSRLPEESVTKLAVGLARSAHRDAPTTPAAHVGYYLIGRGTSELERAARIRSGWPLTFRRRISQSPLSWYLGAMAMLAAGAATVLWAHASTAPGGMALWQTGVIAALGLLAGCQTAMGLVDWITSLLLTPHALPRLDFAKGIPAHARTLVVVPTLIARSQDIEDLAEALEVRFLANRDAQLRFGLLTDFPDAAAETLPGDSALLDQARSCIEALNRKYATAAPADGDDGPRTRDLFFLFHRPRLWNAQERVWMGRERKRGKLEDLNALLLAADGPVKTNEDASRSFSLIVGDMAALAGVKYVITLDTDTQLPRDAARQFVAAMAHPLNRPQHDATGRVVDGHAILQPRVGISLPGTSRSRYARLFGGEPGIDPYTRAVSDIYQDVFDEGSFIGKGIYDVAAFERALRGRLPDNRILSHDLLEGCYARSGLLSDVQLYEDHPARYEADVSRRHRWIRGDWQLAGWLWRSVRGSDSRRRNTLSLLSQWKLFDNLRRSLVPAAFTGLLLAGWAWLPAAWPDSPGWALGWTALVLGMLALPSVCALTLELLRWPDEVRLSQHIPATLRSAQRRLGQLGFALACLPYEAWFSLDAIVRSLWRMGVSRHRLLAWQTSQEVERRAERKPELQGYPALAARYAAMWPAPVLALATGFYLAQFNSHALPAAAPLLFLWALAPAIAWWISLPLAAREMRLDTAQRQLLHRLSRRTWSFFERFVTAQENWLPPDNMQEQPVETVAHRTSPTNIGLCLLANLSAYDFGYLPLGRLLTRSADTLQTLSTMARHHGHFYNWYDTRTLQPLLPMYVSTVDSGNLAAHLLTLRAGLLALPDDHVLTARCFSGLNDTLMVLDDTQGGIAVAELGSLQRELEALRTTPSPRISYTRQALQRCARDAHTLAQALQKDPSSTEEALDWVRALAQQTDAALDELEQLFPWLSLAHPAGLSQHVLTRLAGIAALDTLPSLRQLGGLDKRLHDELENCLVSTLIAARHDDASAAAHTATAADLEWIATLQQHVAQGSARAREYIQQIDNLAAQAGAFAEMDYSFLFDETRNLLSIGYNVAEHRVDAGYYDLLASEARLCSFVAIAQGRLPQASWFSLGRLLTSAGGEPVLLSWSGSMFEYLMPMLVMPSYDNTLLDQTCKASVARQIAYGRQRGVPWGISESAYNAIDLHLNYQYRAFGVPGLGLKRGLGDDLVIAPYACVLALMVAAEEACLNLQRMVSEGFMGRYGFFEAVDYTPSRLPRNQTHAVLRSFMAHHQGMSLLALTHTLLGAPMQRRFASDRLFQAVLLLLQERIPKATALYVHTAQASASSTGTDTTSSPVRLYNQVDSAVPAVQLLSNGRYHVMLTQAGGGYSRWKDLAVTRWREDSTCDHWGSFCYLRELSAEQAGPCWSTAWQPSRTEPLSYEAIFTEGRAEFRRRDAVLPAAGGHHEEGERRKESFETHTEIVVSPEDDIELRRVRITNHSRRARTVELTSYGEVVIAPPDADASHPAFSNLFVQTEILPPRDAILCTRRPRSAGQVTPWLLHLMAVHAPTLGALSCETDRLRFIGRGRSTARPLAMEGGAALSETDGSVLDPVISIRCTLTLAAQESATVDLVTGMADTREAALALIDKYRDRHLAARVFDLAWTHSQVVLRQINASEADTQLYARLAASVLYANASLRADPSVLVRNRRNQSGLWGYAISGDLPIVLLQIGDAGNIGLVRQLVQAHAYWRMKGLAVDLVIWNEDHAGYRQQLQEQILALVASGMEANAMERPGGIFVRAAEQISGEDRLLFQSVARAILSDSRGSLADQLDAHARMETRVPPLLATRPPRITADVPAARAWGNGNAGAARDLILYNGIGGFSRDGREYVITLAPGQATPAPWVNVLANPAFGSVVSERGSAYTWGHNAHEFRLTPWHNDPVGDPGGEAIYLRDEERGQFWSPTPYPAGDDASFVIRHGFGYSVFETLVGGIHSELCIYVALDSAVKFSVLKIRNESGRVRQLSATGYVEWVLGDLRAKSSMHISTGVSRSGALYARNPYSMEFAEKVVFFDVDDTSRSVSGDRREFIGRNGSLREPAALGRVQLSGRLGAGLDPCGAIQVKFELANGQEREIVFRLGIGDNEEDANQIVLSTRGATAGQVALDAVKQHWHQTMGAVQVETPDPTVDVLVNGWLIYQTMACRLWARSGYYQSGGAFGFRDQLQDAMALTHTRPDLLRAQLLLSASRQFVEGDVQHWWHPPSGRGVRTRCSDDYLWLPLATCRYVQVTGDLAVLDEDVAFIEGRPVNPEDDSYYDLPAHSATSASLYEHCVRAVHHGLRFGEHGLPLMGSGDWNDGMNLVGIRGRGESVWLGFFLCEVLRQFKTLSIQRGDTGFAERCSHEALQLRVNLAEHAWDGDWYLRAYFDDGSPLGSASNAECRIDSIAQSWAVLSGASEMQRARQAMHAVDRRLVRRDTGLVQLLDPPFDRSDAEPGYIRGYVPGVRENGGQYTHAAIWAAMAFAQLGERERAWDVQRLINPVRHALSAEDAKRYKVEPYVISADVYSAAPHTGRGGWSWYTGSAGWMYRLLLESLLGLTRHGDTLHITPCLPADWPGFVLHYRHGKALYRLVVTQPVGHETAGSEITVSVDGVLQKDAACLLVDDGREHVVDVNLHVQAHCQ